MAHLMIAVRRLCLALHFHLPAEIPTSAVLRGLHFVWENCLFAVQLMDRATVSADLLCDASTVTL